MQKYVPIVVQILVLTFTLFGIALVMRIPAIMFPQFYGLHAVLVAPFYVVALRWYITGWGHVVPFVVAVCLFSSVLAIMSPIMGFSNVLPIAMSMVVYAALQNKQTEIRITATAISYGVLCYPCTLFVGAALGGVALTSTSALYSIILVVIAFGLSLLASFVPCPFAHTRKLFS